MSALKADTEPMEQTASWQPAKLLNSVLTAGACDVVRHWVTHADYLDEYNEPVMLPAVLGDEPGFGRLVRAANNYLSPLSVLGELLRKGVVEQLGDSQLLLRRSAYVQVSGPP
ncbi:hypothetical protein [Marinobacter sp. X15-166B]|uniref:hypothetical protein n=1 Tax=Marinobacter sp. X15-166B TaxID=1897620 RepID=UPI00085C67FB|nr:hypothetical protein [Marinobacter sp. X15-166B]OEY65475.1 hypothetical protein BG841_02710 [Marinobacter sp. X15-166B]